MSYHFSPIRLAKIGKGKQCILSELWEIGTLVSLERMQTGITLRGEVSSMKQNVFLFWLSSPTSSNLPWRYTSKKKIHMDKVCTTALGDLKNTEKKLNIHPFKNGWINAVILCVPV